AFLGGVLNYVLTHDRWFKEYVLAYTNASTIIQEGFQDTEDLAGLFSGYNPQTHRYNARNGHWGYQHSSCDPNGELAGVGQAFQPDGGASQAKKPDLQGDEEAMIKDAHGVHGDSLMAGSPSHCAPRGHMTDGPGDQPRHDPTLQHPRCVM